MTFRGKKYRRISIKIKPLIVFKHILDALDDIVLPDTEAKPQDIKYAILEMVNNSIRVHRDNDIADPLTLIFEYENTSLTIVIEDRGPGFNPEKLPYSLNDDPQSVDLKSEQFTKYREQHDYKRFGMGLFLVRKTFRSFKLTFLDIDGIAVPWVEGKIHGTSIKVGI